MKTLLVCFVLTVNILGDVYSQKDKCTKCIPKEKCGMFGDMSKREQDDWMEKNPCEKPENEDLGPLFGFAPMAKGDLVCCPNSNIWGVESPKTSREVLGGQGNDNLGNRFNQGDDGYNQDNLHKKQNSNINRDDNDDEDVFNYEKQRYRPNRRPNGRKPPRNNNINQPYIQGGNNYGLPVFGPNGMPITSNDQNFNRNNYNQPISGMPNGNGFNQPSRPSNGNNFNEPNGPYGNNYNDPYRPYENDFNRPNDNYNPNPIPNRVQCRISVLPPDRESGCCGLDLASERMYGAQANFVNRPSNSNYRPAGGNPWTTPNRRFTRETPEEVGISLDNRIAGGKETDLYQFPWTVLLKTTFDYENKKTTFNCGGSLISSRYVLTAAHCVSEPNAVVSNIDVYLAEYDKRTFPRDCMNSPEGRKCVDNILVQAEEVHAHPYYDDEKLQSDIALIRLQKNVPYTEYTRPICLPPINIDNPEYSNLRLAVAGWGRNGSVPSDLKQSTVVNLVPQKQCSRSYPSLTKQHVCAAGRTGEDTCKGDSGGPLMMLFEGKYYVSGVVSGKRADAPCGTSVPSLYTNVFQFLPWIQQTLRN